MSVFVGDYCRSKSFSSVISDNPGDFRVVGHYFEGPVRGMNGKDASACLVWRAYPKVHPF